MHLLRALMKHIMTPTRTHRTSKHQKYMLSAPARCSDNADECHSRLSHIRSRNIVRFPKNPPVSYYRDGHENWTSFHGTNQRRQLHAVAHTHTHSLSLSRARWRWGQRSASARSRQASCNCTPTSGRRQRGGDRTCSRAGCGPLKHIMTPTRTRRTRERIKNEKLSAYVMIDDAGRRCSDNAAEC